MGAEAMTPDDIGPLAAALAKATTEFATVTRDKTVTVQTKSGGSYSFKYAPLDSVLAAVRGPLSKNGLALVQMLDEGTLETLLIHESGAFLSGRVALPEGADIQTLGSAITYLRRYAISAILGIATEDDDDGNAASTQKREPMKSYIMTRRVAASDDEEGGAVIREGISDEVEEMQKEGIKDMMRQLKKPLSKKAIKEITGLEYTPENFDGIYKKLKVELEKTDPLEAAFPSNK